MQAARAASTRPAPTRPPQPLASTIAIPTSAVDWIRMWPPLLTELSRAVVLEKPRHLPCPFAVRLIREVWAGRPMTAYQQADCQNGQAGKLGILSATQRKRRSAGEIFTRAGSRLRRPQSRAPRRARLERRRWSSTGYSMTWSARSRTDCGIVRPSALAVLRLTTNLNFVGCSMGISEGLAPLKILSAMTAARRFESSSSAP